MFSAEAVIQQLIAEPLELKLYFTNGKRVEMYDLESGVRTTVIDKGNETYGLAVDRNSR